MPRPRDLKKLDQLFAERFVTKTVNTINEDNNLNLKPYKAHTDREIETIYNNYDVQPNRILAKKISAIHKFYDTAENRYADNETANQLSKKDELGRLWAYTLEPNISADPEEQSKIKDTNDIVLMDYLTLAGKKEEFLKGMLNQVLNTDLSPLLSSDEGVAMSFVAEHMQLCELAWVFDNDFLPMLEAKGIQLNNDQKKQLEDKKVQLQRAMEVIKLADFMASDSYPLLADNGYGKALGNIYAYGFGVNSSYIPGTDDYVNGQEKILNGSSTHVQSFYAYTTKKAVEDQLQSYIEQRNEIRLDDDEEPDTIEKLIENGCITKSGERYPEGTEKETVLNDIVADRKVRIMLPGNNTISKFPMDLKVNMEENELEIYSAATEKVKNRLVELKNRLVERGTTILDSPQYGKMLEAIGKLTDDVSFAELNTCEKLTNAMQELYTAADNYYFAKLDQKKNDTRFFRFNIAREIKQMYQELQKNELHVDRENQSEKELKDELKETIIDKLYKSETIMMIRYKFENSPATKNEQEADFIKEDNEKRQRFYSGAKEIKNQVEGEEPRTDQKLIGYCVRDFKILYQNSSVEDLERICRLSKHDLVNEISKRKPENQKNKQNPQNQKNKEKEGADLQNDKQPEQDVLDAQVRGPL